MTALQNTSRIHQEQKEELQPEQVTCSICMGGKENGPLCNVSHRTTKFFHKFHLNCINEWLSRGQRKCPNCKQPMKAIHIATNPSTVSEDEEQPLIQQEHVIEIRDPSIRESLVQEFQQASLRGRISMVFDRAIIVAGFGGAAYFTIRVFQEVAFSHFVDSANHH